MRTLQQLKKQCLMMGAEQEQQQTPETVVDNERGQEQEDVEAVIVIEDNKDNEKQKENNDVPALSAEQDNKDSTTTQESVVDNGRG